MRGLMAVILLFIVSNVQAETILMARAKDNFDATIEAAKQSLGDHGYVVSHVQRCDGGLKDFGFTTAPYRVLFFGKPKEVRNLSNKYPEIIPFLPLKMAVFEEDGEVLAVLFNPEELSPMFAQPELTTQFRRWRSDFDSILTDIRGQ